MNLIILCSLLFLILILIPLDYWGKLYFYLKDINLSSPIKKISLFEEFLLSIEGERKMHLNQLPQYRHFKVLIISTLNASKKYGVSSRLIFAKLLQQLKTYKNSEIKILEIKKSFFAQFILAGGFIWVFYYYCEYSLQLPFSANSARNLILIQSISITFFVISGHLLKLILLAEWENVMMQVYLLEGLLNCSVPLTEIVAEIKLQKIYKKKGTERFRQSVQNAINQFKQSGDDIMPRIEMIQNDIWVAYEQLLALYTRVMGGVRFCALILTCLGGYFYLQFELISRIKL